MLIYNEAGPLVVIVKISVSPKVLMLSPVVTLLRPKVEAVSVSVLNNVPVARGTLLLLI
jgi:hypothetical protein